MKKEVFVAILLGLSFGLIVTYGIYRASQADTQQQLATILDTANLSQENDTNESISTIVIDAPLNESIVDEQRQTIAGTTLSNSFVIIYVNETPYITNADQAGAFSVSADLRLGSNIIGVHSLNENGEESISEIVVGYTTQPLFSQAASPSADVEEPESSSSLFTNFTISFVKKAQAQTATSSSNTQDNETTSEETAEEDLSVTTRNLRERIERIVEEKRDQIKGVLSEIDSKRRATIGEIQRVTEDTLSIRSQTGTEIIPITNTRYPLSILKDGEPINFNDIAVGNWLLAFGVIEEDTFQPIRLLVSDDSLRPRTRSVSIGTITDIGRTTIEIESRTGQGTTTYTTSANTEYQDLSGEIIGLNDIEESMQAIIAGVVSSTNETDKTTTRTALKVKVLTTIDTAE